MRMGFDFIHSRGPAVFGSFARTQVLSVGALGSTIADAALITKECIIWATGADATKGIQLPTPSGPGATILVVNDKTANAVLKVWPPSGSTKINGGSAGAALSMAAKTAAWYVSLDGVGWDTLPLLPS